ncbi:MAG: hypothetical protein V4596_00405 [Bdellovibrionota bacterium]
MFKILIIALVSSLAMTNVMAIETILKTCDTDVRVNDLGTMNILINIMSNNGVLSVNVKQTIEGHSVSAKANASITEGGVRAGLSDDALESVEFDTEDYNSVEKLIIHTMNLAKNPETKAFSSVGLDLERARSAKAYTFGSEEDDDGLKAVIEAKDEKGRDMGSFFSGPMSSPCK